MLAIKQAMSKDMVGKTVQVRGWIYRTRSSGGIVFAVLRDHTGVVQVTVKKGNLPDPDFESAVMELYWLYSEKFPEHEAFWISMADDERKNTEWVKSIIEKVNQGAMDYNRDRFNIEAIRTTLNFVKSQIQAAQSQPVTLPNALGNAVGIEDSLAKRKFYELIKDDNPEGKQLYQRLQSENQRHREKLNQFRQKHK